MALVTRCPNCATAFRVTPEHLQMQGGNVRCGHCSQVFDSFTTLATVQDSEIVSYSKESSVDTPQKDTLGAFTTGVSAEEELVQEASNVANAEEGNYTFDVALPPKSSRIWGLVSIFLLVALTGQIVYLYRTELSIIAPGARPYLEQYCKILNCTIPLPQQVELLSIESSDMQTGTGQHTGVITLTAIVSNQAHFPQAFPSFELTLTDTQDRALASRIFTPSEYLEENIDPFKAIAPSSEISVTLYIDSGIFNAVGYRLFLLYP
jgi:predicted Zn finger-like uncharacterized protein